MCVSTHTYTLSMVAHQKKITKKGDHSSFEEWNQYHKEAWGRELLFSVTGLLV